MSAIEKFSRKWGEELKFSTTPNLRAKLFPEPPLKHKLNSVLTKLRMQVDKLDQVSSRLMDRDKKLFEKIVDAYARRDSERAAIYAHELTELRKMSKVVLYSKLSLEKVLLRLTTIKDVGDLLAIMAPTLGVVGAIKGCLSGILPGAELELEEVGNMLNSLIIEVGEVTGQTPPLEASDEAQRILQEAMAIAEQRIKACLPETPTSFSSDLQRGHREP